MRIYHPGLFRFSGNKAGKIFSLAGLLSLLFIQAPMPCATAQKTSGTVAVAPSTAVLTEQYGKLPLSFEANQGQTDPQVRFLSRGNGYSLFLTDREAVLALRKSEKHEPSRQAHTATDRPSLQTDVIRMQLAGASSGLSVSGVDKLTGTANYFVGSDPKSWLSSVPTYSRVEYSQVYPGINLAYYGNQQQLEYDFIVTAKADPGLIRIRFAGAQKLKVSRDGSLEIATGDGEIVFHKPVVYQESEGRREPVEGQFKLTADNTVGFAIGAYDRSKTLVIDPTVVYSTYFGPSATPSAIAADSNGDVYVTGAATATNFPATSGAYQTTLGSAYEAAFITKFNSSGTSLVYSTYLGGSLSASAAGIAVDSSGNAYVTGATDSPNFPVTSGAYQTTFYGSPSPFGSAFVTKLNASGTALLYSTFLSGPPITSGPFTGDTDSSGAGIAIDSSGNAYVTGASFTGGFPVTAGAYNFPGTSYAGSFISKISADGSALVYSAFVGDDQTTSISIDSSGDAYAAGSTSDTDFPATTGAFQTVNKAGPAGNNATVVELSASGSTLVYATYVGGSVDTQGTDPGDSANGIAVDGSGNAYITGKAFSNDFPVTTGAFQTANNGGASGTYNAFVSKLNPSGSGLVYSTFVGGSGGGSAGGGGDFASGIAIDSAGDAYITGTAVSPNFPTTSNAFQASNHATPGSSNAFVTELNPAGSALLFSTYLGGSDQDSAVAIATDTSGNAYVTGPTISYDFPVTSGSYETTYPGGGSIFVAKALLGSGGTSSSPVGTTTTVAASPNPQVAGQTVTFTVTVVPATGTGTPTGEVTTTIDGTAGPTLTLTSGQATFTSSTLAAGTHTIVASYGGDANYSASSGSVVETITSAAPPVTATPSFTPAAGTYTSAQSVSISDATSGATIYYTTDGTTPTTASTQYSAPISVTASETIEAIAVASSYGQSAVGMAAYIINLPAASFTLSASPASITLNSGQSGTSSLTITPQNGFTQAVSFSCTGLPSGDSCTFSPSTVSPAGAPVSTTLTIGSSTTAASPSYAPWKAVGGGMALTLLFWPFRRKARYRLAVIALSAIIFAVAGCGTGAKAKQYTVTVTATGGTATQTASIALTVTQ